MERNEHYHGRPAYLDGIEFAMDIIWRDAESYFRMHDEAFNTYRIDITRVRGDIAQAVEAGKLDIYGELIFAETPTSIFMAFNSSLPPYDDLHFRRALALALDVQALIERKNGWKKAESLLPPNISGHDPEAAVTGYDAHKAVNELSNSKYYHEASELELSLHDPPEGSLHDTDLKHIMNNWSETLNLSGYVDNVSLPVTYKAMLQENKVQIRTPDGTFKYPHPEDLLGKFNNMFGDSNSSSELLQVQRLLREAATENDSVEQLSKYSEVEKRILEDGLALPIAWITGGYYIRAQPWVRDLKVQKYHGSIFKDVWFDKTHPGYNERAMP